MRPSLSVLLLHRDDRDRHQLRVAFEALEGVQVVGERSDLRSGMAMAHQLKPTILVLEMNGNTGEVLAAASQYRLEHPDGAIFLATDVVNPETLMSAMRAGAQEILRSPLDRSALGAAVDRVMTLVAAKSGHGRSRSIITVFSHKGGVGVTTLAVNLAAGIRRLTKLGVAIADFDVQGGAVASTMGLSPVRSVADLTDAERIDSASVQGLMTRHRCGVDVLAQPETFTHEDTVNAQLAGGLLDVLGAIYPNVVIDAPHAFGDLALELFDRSSTILLVTELTVPSLRSARRAIDVFHRLNYLVIPDRVQLVVNRHTERSPITLAQAEEALGLKMHVVANDYASVTEAGNLGQPLCLEAPVNKIGRDVDALIRALIPIESPGEEAPAPARRPLLKMFGKGQKT